MAAIRADLPAGFDPDRGCYLHERGRKLPAERGWPELRALDPAAGNADASFRDARDRQLARLNTRAAEAGLTGGGELPPETDGRPGPLEILAAQAQLAAFLERRDTLTRAQDFLVAAPSRSTPRTRAAHSRYATAPHNTRAALLAALEPRPPLFEPPKIRR